MAPKLLFPLTAVTALIIGCSPAPPAAEKKADVPEKAAAPAEPVSAQSALFAIYQVARTWAGDVEVLKLENINIDEVKSQPGKYGAWRATMATKAGKKKREYTYAAVEVGPTLHKGVFAQAEQGWITSMQSRSFAIQAVKIDSPAAVEEALKNKDVQNILKKKPDLPVQIQLEWSAQTQVPAYRVIWGQSVSTSDVSIYIDSQTGTFLKKSS